MKVYASRTGTRRNLAELRRVGWGLLVSRAGVWRTEGFEDFVADNGAWADFQASRAFDDEAFERFLIWIEAEPIRPRWIVLPDIVAGGLPSLALSLRYLNRCLGAAEMVLIAVQDGMAWEDVAPYIGPSVGIFLGGSTEWKLETMTYWGGRCLAERIYYHVARVNSVRRMSLAIAANAHSVDGTAGSRYAVNIRKLDNASRQGDFLAHGRMIFPTG